MEVAPQTERHLAGECLKSHPIRAESSNDTTIVSQNEVQMAPLISGVVVVYEGAMREARLWTDLICGASQYFELFRNIFDYSQVLPPCFQTKLFFASDFGSLGP